MACTSSISDSRRPQNPQTLQRLFVVHHVFTTGTGTTDVDGRDKYASRRSYGSRCSSWLPGTFELFVNHFVHLGAGIHQGGGDDG